MVAGRYRLIEPLGRGGMGTVWRALDETLQREVAVKELDASRDLTTQDRELFAVRTFREARAAGRLSHPGVAAVYDVFEETGHPWIVMQLVRSRTLGEEIRAHGPLPPRRVAEIGLQVLSALRAAHGAGVLHRDVKPDNVLLAEDGRAVLTDFGIATLEDDSPVTRTGALVGTPAFIAPERAAGGSAQRSSDLWSLGVTMFAAVEGRSPFHRGHALASLAAVMYEDPVPMRRAGVLAPVLTELLRKDPAQRMTTPEAERLLRSIAAGYPPMPTEELTPGRTRGWTLAAVAGVLLVGVATGGVAYLTAESDAKPPPPTPKMVITPASPEVSPSDVPTSIQKSEQHPAKKPRKPPPSEKRDNNGRGNSEDRPNKGTGNENDQGNDDSENDQSEPPTDNLIEPNSDQANQSPAPA